MARARVQPVIDPVHGLEMELGAGDQGVGDLVVLTRVAPGGELAEHFHIGIEERWQAVEGEIEIRRDGRWHRLTPAGGTLTVAPGQRHSLRNRSGMPVRLRTVASPGRNLDRFIQESAWAARAGLFNRRGLPTGPRGLIWAIDFAWRFRDETVVCRPPPLLQRILLPPARRLTAPLRRK